jgi:hypothetical protein
MPKDGDRVSTVLRILTVLLSAVLVLALVVFSISIFYRRGRDTVKADSVQQEASYSAEQLCGLYSLHTAAALIGVPIDFSELIEEARPSVKGICMKKLKETAARFGLRASAYRMTWENLVALSSPAILHVKENHFVLVAPPRLNSSESKAEVRVYNGDEAPQWWSRAKMTDIWSGASLIIEKRQELRRKVGPAIRINSLVYDLGTVMVPAAKKQKIPIICENEGTTVLELDKITTSCGCTKSFVSDNTIEPGNRGRVEVLLDLERTRGPFNHTVVIQTNDPRNPVVRIRITGQAYNTHLIQRKELLLDAIPQGSSVSKCLVLHDPGDSSLTAPQSNVYVSSSLKSSGARIELDSYCKPYDTTLGLFRDASERDFLICVKAIAAHDAELGDFQGVLKITTSIKANPTIKIPVIGRVVTDMVASPPALFFAMGEGESVTKRIVIMPRTACKRAFTNAVTTDSLLTTTQIRTLESGTSFHFDVTCSISEDADGSWRGNIEYQFDDGAVVKLPVFVSTTKSYDE